MKNYRVSFSNFNERKIVYDFFKMIDRQVITIDTSLTCGIFLYYYIPTEEKTIILGRSSLLSNDVGFYKFLESIGVSFFLDYTFLEFQAVIRSEKIKKIINND